MASAPRLSVNEQRFIIDALRLEQRIDGRRPFDARRLFIKLGREDGSAEVQAGETHVVANVSAVVAQPYRERPNEGTLAVYTEFSPMAGSVFEVGRPGEFTVELGRIIDRGLRESRAIDTESLCILSGKAVWAVRVDITILDNGGNLVDAANVAALAALLSFRRPECSVGGQDGQEIIIHPPEIREPIPLIIHHLPIAVTFAFFGEGDMVVLDPNYKEEAVMGSRITITMNTHGDVCAVQKGGGLAVSQSEIMRCFRIASTKAADITTKLKQSVDIYAQERAQRKIKRHYLQCPTTPNGSESKMTRNAAQEQVDNAMEIQKVLLNETDDKNSIDMEEEESEEDHDLSARIENIHDEKESASFFVGGPSKWDPHAQGISAPQTVTISIPSHSSECSDEVKGHNLETTSQIIQQVEATMHGVEKIAVGSLTEEHVSSGLLSSQIVNVSRNEPQSLQDAIKEKARRKKKKKGSVKTET